MGIQLDSVSAKAVQVALDIGLFSELESGVFELQDLCSKLQVSNRGLKSLTSLLSSVSLLTEEQTGFALAPETKTFLDEEWPAVRDDMPPAPDWDKLEQAVRTGTCVVSPIEGKDDGGDFFTGVVDTLFAFHWKIAQALEASIHREAHAVLDLGAGSAVWSLGLASQRSNVQVAVVDHQKVLTEITERFVSDKKLTEQYDFLAGSYHEVQLEPEHYDVVYLGHIIHSEGWVTSATLLQRCYKTLKPGGQLVVAEWIASEPRSQDYHANLFDLNMLMFTQNGLVFTAKEMEQLVEQAGFQNSQWVSGPGRYPTLVTQKPKNAKGN